MLFTPDDYHRWSSSRKFMYHAKQAKGVYNAWLQDDCKSIYLDDLYDHLCHMRSNVRVDNTHGFRLIRRYSNVLNKAGYFHGE